jgi:hypothetical protein
VVQQVKRKLVAALAWQLYRKFVSCMGVTLALKILLVVVPLSESKYMMQLRQAAKATMDSFFNWSIFCLEKTKFIDPEINF